MKFTEANYGSIQKRIEVFVKEQGFRDEFDDIDAIAIHFVAYDEGNRPIGTCRIFTVDDPQIYLLGRLAVVKDYRGKGLGKVLLEQADTLATIFKLDELTAEVLPHNAASRKLFQSLEYAEEQNGEFYVYRKRIR